MAEIASEQEVEVAHRIQGIGRILAYVRETAGISQAALAKAMKSNPTRVYRFESGEVLPTEVETASYLRAVRTDLASDCHRYLNSQWADESLRPPFPHPNWESLLLIDQQLARIEELKNDPETKAVFVRALDLYAADLRRCADFLKRIDHYLVFIGVISVGKTSAICTSLGLTLPNSELPFVRRMVLEVGGGRTTLCEVRVESGPRYGVIIEPCTDEGIRRYVLDYADHLLALARQPAKPKNSETDKAEKRGGRGKDKSKPTEEIPWVSEEMARAIRGLAGLTEPQAQSLAHSFPMKEELAIQILGKMDLFRRRDTTVWCPSDDHATKELEWLQKVFKDINNGRRPGFSLPRRINVVIPDKLFDAKLLNIGVIDTKGVDQASARADIDSHFDDPHAIPLLCTKFGEAPDLPTVSLIQRAMGLHSDSSLDDRMVVLVLPRNEEAMEMKDELSNDFVESRAAGYEVKLMQVKRALQPLKADHLPIKFLNAASSEDTAKFREFVIQQFQLLRRRYVDRVAETVMKIDELIDHRTTEERALAVEEVMDHLRVWARDNRSLEETQRPDQLLENEIRFIHARTLWASVRREGAWDNFDYYYQLGYATRQIVASTAGERVKNLRAVIDNLAGNPEYASAAEFLRQIAEHVDGAVDSLTRQAQVFGEAIYRDPLQAATEYWDKCERVYGTGSPYRAVVAAETSKWFNHEAASALYKRLVDEVNRGWEELVCGLERILEAPVQSTVA
jgi:transcriptional regulator with XRE-family HTH domain